MKVEVEIPEGKLCKYCIFKVTDICRLLKKRLDFGIPKRKLADCPAFKENEE